MSRRLNADTLPSLSREVTQNSTKASRRGMFRNSRQATKLSSLSRNATDLSMANQSTRAGKRKGAKNLEEELKKTMPKGWNIREGFQGREHFRKVVKFVIVFMKWIMALREEAEKTGGGGSEALAGLADQDFAAALVKTEGASFDLNNYRAKKEVLLSSDVREILNHHPTLRSPEQVQLAKYGLQHVKSFSEYPLHMQEKLATVAYFQEIDAKRVIIREGHQAENFYFILSGSAIVRELVTDKETGMAEMRPVKQLRKGDSFGEMELLHHAMRKSTIVSLTPMTLLVVGRDNFIKVFMSAQDEHSLPEHIKFIGNLEVMRGFPLDTLVENPDKCLLHFFRRGEVMVKNSQESAWLYFIKSGSCEVMKLLKSSAKLADLASRARPKLPTRKLPVDYSLCLPRLGTGAQSSRTNNGLKSLPPPKPKNPLQKALLKNKDKDEKSSKKKVDYFEGDFLSKEDDSLPLLQMERRLEEDLDFSDSYRNMIKSLDLPKDPTTPHRNAAKSESGAGLTASRFDKLTVIKNRKKPAHTPSPPPYAASMIRKPKVKFDDEVAKEPEPEAEMGSEHTAESPDSEKPELILPKPEPGPVYVQLDTLKPRDVFGLANIRFDEFLENKSVAVSLISRGAECIMVEKEFFVEHATPEVRHLVMSLIRPYPDADTLQGNLHLKSGWDSYREEVIKDSRIRVGERKETLRKSFSVY